MVEGCSNAENAWLIYLELLISSKLGHKFVVGQIQCEPAIFFNGFKLIARSVANLGESPRSIWVVRRWRVWVVRRGRVRLGLPVNLWLASSDLELARDCSRARRVPGLLRGAPASFALPPGGLAWVNSRLFARICSRARYRSHSTSPRPANHNHYFNIVSYSREVVQCRYCILILDQERDDIGVLPWRSGA